LKPGTPHSLIDIDGGISTDAKNFAHKVARSIKEISRNVNSITDVFMFLEVLGYDDDSVKKRGFKDMMSLATHIYGFIDFFRNRVEPNDGDIPIPSVRSRIAEGLAITFQWFGPLMLLFLTGASFWIVMGLPLQSSTALITGVFIGIVLAEGPLHAFSRLFSFYYNQANIGELRRILKRSYATTLTLLTVAMAVTYLTLSSIGIPASFTAIVIISAVTLTLHRASYIAIYSMKKFKTMVSSYLVAFVVFSLIFFLTDSIFTNITARYFISLIVGFLVLFAFAMYTQLKILGKKSVSHVTRNAPHFYTQFTVRDKTLKSKFSVQFSETLPYFLFGVFYFILAFSDRVISWFFNPISLVLSNGVVLPFSFNFVYQIGADLSMTLLLIPTTIIQYIVMIPTYPLILNKSTRAKDSNEMNSFFRRYYLKLLAISLSISITSAVLIAYFITPEVIADFTGLSISSAAISIEVLRYALVANIMLSAIYTTNSYFLILFNKIKALATLTALSAAALIAIGIYFAASGFENIIFSYVIAITAASVISSAYVASSMRNPTSLFFSRYNK